MLVICNHAGKNTECGFGCKHLHPHTENLSCKLGTCLTFDGKSLIVK